MHTEIALSKEIDDVRGQCWGILEIGWTDKLNFIKE